MGTDPVKEPGRRTKVDTQFVCELRNHDGCNDVAPRTLDTGFNGSINLTDHTLYNEVGLPIDAVCHTEGGE